MTPSTFVRAVRWETAERSETCARTRGVITDDWMTGRTAFGGLGMAAAAHAASLVAGEDRLVRGVSASFVAPLGDGPAEASAEVLRAGRSLSHISARVEQEGRVGVAALIALGTTRDTAIGVDGPPRPEAPDPEGLPPMPYIEGIIPKFTRNLDFRWATANVPFSNTGDAHILGWIRPRGAERLDELDLYGMFDGWPPPIWSLIDRPAPGSTGTWQITRCAGPRLDEYPADSWFLYESRPNVSAEGYCDFTAHLWAPDGRLVAIGRQVFVEFTKRG